MDWIERWFRVAPDNGDGSLEMLISLCAVAAGRQSGELGRRKDEVAGRINAINAESQDEADCIAARQAARQKARVHQTFASLGYDTITVKDFKLDGKELASLGKRVAISGYYCFLEQNAEYLHSSSTLFAFGHAGNSDDGILILTDNATRYARAAFLDCRQNGSGIGCNVNYRGTRHYLRDGSHSANAPLPRSGRPCRGSASSESRRGGEALR